MHTPLILGFGSDVLGVMIPLVAVGGGLCVAVVSVISKAIRRTAESRHKEESRREIAAYVAEGSMSPDDAYKILNAGTPVDGKSKCC
jgi:hypothetical protein